MANKYLYCAAWGFALPESVNGNGNAGNPLFRRRHCRIHRAIFCMLSMPCSKFRAPPPYIYIYTSSLGSPHSPPKKEKKTVNRTEKKHTENRKPNRRNIPSQSHHTLAPCAVPYQTGKTRRPNTVAPNTILLGRSTIAYWQRLCHRYRIGPVRSVSRPVCIATKKKPIEKWRPWSYILERCDSNWFEQ